MAGQPATLRLGLPGIARSLTALADGSGGIDALDAARRGAAAVRSRGACAHPDGVFRFVLSALDVFTDDLTAHLFRGTCGRPVLGILPLPPDEGETLLSVDWTRGRAHGLCAHLAPQLVQLDGQGYPVFLDMPVAHWLRTGARQAVQMCPSLALRLTALAPHETAKPPIARQGGNLKLIASTPPTRTWTSTRFGSPTSPNVDRQILPTDYAAGVSQAAGVELFMRKEALPTMYSE